MVVLLLSVGAVAISVGEVVVARLSEGGISTTVTSTSVAEGVLSVDGEFISVVDGKVPVETGEGAGLTSDTEFDDGIDPEDGPSL